ncbi:MAG: CDP-glycerol glycerophosphotransferase family protein [Pseudomonadota bacterium]
MPKYVEVVNALVQWALACLIWVVAFPAKLLLKRDRNLVAVIGRNMTAFADNTKHFYSTLSSDGHTTRHVVLVTREPQLVQALRELGGRAERYPHWAAISSLLRCGTLIVDAPEWGSQGVAALTRGARIVQLWHGAPLKHIELDVYRRRKETLPGWIRLPLDWQKSAVGRYPIYDDVVVTSRHFADTVFRGAFSARNFPAMGYPRNDALLNDPWDEEVKSFCKINVDMNTHSAICAARETDRTVCLFMPTFRGVGDDTLKEVIDLARLSDFAADHRMLVVFKLHPYVESNYDLSGYPALTACSPGTDIYPLLPLCDILITDYSSVFFDFLLLDRPIVFLPYDLETYLSSDRSMYFDYDAMTPGPHCRDMDELETVLRQIQEGIDEHAEARLRMRQLAHDHCDGGSSLRISRYLGLS